MKSKVVPPRLALPLSPVGFATEGSENAAYGYSKHLTS